MSSCHPYYYTHNDFSRCLLLLFVLTNTCKTEKRHQQLALAVREPRRARALVCVYTFRAVFSFCAQNKIFCQPASGWLCAVCRKCARVPVHVYFVFMDKTSDYNSLWWYVLQYNLRSFTLSLDTAPYLPLFLSFARSLCVSSLCLSLCSQPYPTRIKYPFTYSVVVYFTHRSARIAAISSSRTLCATAMAALWRSLSICGRRNATSQAIALSSAVFRLVRCESPHHIFITVAYVCRQAQRCIARIRELCQSNESI